MITNRANLAPNRLPHNFDVGWTHVELAVAASHIARVGEARGMKNVMKTKTAQNSEQRPSILTIPECSKVGVHAMVM
jgi:hypothetical protein